MATYTIQIDEAQRQVILQALKLLDPVVLTKNDPDLEYLIPSLETLPQVEEENPGIIHGLCL